MKKELFDFGWTFWKEGHETSKQVVDLPYDAMRYEDRIPNLKSGHATGFFPGGTYYYEKTFEADADMVSGTTFLEFEGVYQKSTVTLNGEVVGGRIYGYSDFMIDLTGKLKEGSNTLCVKADNSQYGNARWYTGSGIYKDVWLYTAGPSYIKPCGIKVLTKSIDPAVLSVSVDAVLEEGMELVTEVIAKGGAVVATGTGAELELTIPDAKLWSAEDPNLYGVHVSLMKGDTLVDRAGERVGIRSLAWDAKNGFQVNGTTVKLKGGCVHEDNGPLGANSFKAAEVRRIRKMKECGYNAVRYAHQPAGKAFLDACDEVGMYVMDETFDTWVNTKNDYDYANYFETEWEKDLTDMVRMAYNHPSVILYSIGNEVYLKDLEKATPLSDALIAKTRELDASRPVVNCMNPLMTLMGGGNVEPEKKDEKGDPAPVEDADAARGSLLVNMLITAAPKLLRLLCKEKKIRTLDPVLEPLDIVGFNYGDHLYEAHHKDYPERIMVGSETLPAKLAINWPKIETSPYLIGDFMWTAWDYLGEAGVGLPVYDGKKAFSRPYPCISAGCCSIDMTGFIESQGHFTSIVWGKEDPYIAVHPVDHYGEPLEMGRWRKTDAVHSWSWKGQEGKPCAIDVFSNGDVVELIQDGVSLGKKPVEEFCASFETTYRPGRLEAVSYRFGRVYGRDVLATASEERALTMKPETTELNADGMDLCYIPVILGDRNGTPVMLEDKRVTVTVDGPAELIAVGSGAIETEEVFFGNSYSTFHGRMLAVLRAGRETGTVTVTAAADGLEPVSTTIEVK